MAKSKNKFIFSLFIVGSFIIYTVAQSLSRISGFLGNGATTATAPNTPVAQNNQILAINQTPTAPAAPVTPNTPAASGISSAPAATSPTISNGGPGPMARVRGQMMAGQYRDGSYTGVSADAYYGNVQVKAIIQSGKIVDVQFLDYPQDRQNSININSFAVPALRSEAIAAQSANVDIVSGATETSQAFIQSLQSALSQA